jgi:uncharacterized protein DUF4339
MPAWFCKINGKVYGPYTGDKLRQMVREDRLLPDDSLREGQDGEWFAAREMENLFPDFESLEEVEDESSPRGRKKKGADKPSNYYRVFFQNLTEGGQWRAFLVANIAVGFLLSLVFLIINFLTAALLRRIGALVESFLLGSLLALLLPAILLFLDALVFGIPCVLMRVRLNPRRHSALDLLALCHLIGVVPKLVILIATIVSPVVAVFLALLYPFLHAGVLAYFMMAWWGFSGQNALILAGIRFLYQSAVVIGYIAYMLLL